MRKDTKRMIFQRLLSLALALTMLMALLPAGVLRAQAAEGDITLYLEPNDNWLSDGAEFAVYCFENSEDTAELEWINMEEAEEGYYKAEISEAYSKVIFCRMNPNRDQNRWNNDNDTDDAKAMWNQTADLDVGQSNCFTLKADSWDDGTWSTYTPEPDPNAAYYVAGAPELCGSNWVENDTDNQMTWNGKTARYEKVYNAAPGTTYSLKVTNGTWSGAWGDNGNNYQFVVTENCEVTVTFDPTSKAVNVIGNQVAPPPALVIQKICAAGEGPGGQAWLNGEKWNPKSDANVMTKDPNADIYRITYHSVPKGLAYVVKFAANSGWDHNWGGSFDQSGAAATANYDGSNITFNIDYDAADVTLELDLTEFKYATKEGAKFTITIAKADTTPDEPEVNYYVAGDKIAVFGEAWNPEYADNKMTLNAEGTYEKTYEKVSGGRYNFKITDGTWEKTWTNGDGDENNSLLEFEGESNVTITFDPAGNGTITVKIDPIEEEKPSATYYLIGWINGADHGCEGDYANMGDYKFVDGKVTATFNQDSYVFVKSEGNANWYMTDVLVEGETTATLKNTSTGASEKVKVPGNKKLEFTLTENEDGTLTLAYAEIPEEPAVEYYLVGNINGADYGIEGDKDNVGTYKFVNGQLVTTFSVDSYVMVKTGDNSNWFMTDGWLGKEVTRAVLYKEPKDANKLYVPGGVEVTFTLEENTDGTLTLSYALPETITPIEVEKIIAAGNGGDVGGGKWLNGKNWAPGDDANKMTETAPGIFEITYRDVPKGKGYAVKFAANGGWDNLVNWGGKFSESGVETRGEPNGGNLAFDIDYETADVTLKLDLTKCDKNTKQGAVITVTIEGRGQLTYNANLHFQKPADWADGINVWAWDGGILGYEGIEWPGKPASADTINAGWYNFTAQTSMDAGFNFIFNDFVNGAGNQTDDLATGSLKPVTDLWIVDGKVLTAAPAGWVDPNRRVCVPGTFPGPSWDAGSNEMTYNPDLGLYVYTFHNVPAANYEFKIAIDGGWNENYGAEGAFDGGNISVEVPENMDVIVYYNDRSHRAVTNVDYSFVDVTLSGTGIPEDAKLTDKDLTGIYSVGVELAAGDYSDLKLTVAEDGKSKEYVFTAFTLTEHKTVNFYFDPSTGFYYHDGSSVVIGPDAIFYDSKDIAYKDPFGAVEQNTDAKFTLDTGMDIDSADLIVKGVGSFPMTKKEAQDAQGNQILKWTCTAQFPKIGEYQYYFAVSKDGAVKVYGDDDGYYGTGVLTDLTNVRPYALVVYKSGFTTPDWMKNAVIYQIFPDRFFDGDPSNNRAQTTARGAVDYEYVSNWYLLPENPEQEKDYPNTYPTYAFKGDGNWSNEIYGGDLRGITEKIDYLEALGVNVIYLNPVFASISNHRYDACDYTKIDPILGTLGDFSELVRTAEAHDMKVVLDGVFNHVSDDSIYFDRYYKFLGTSNKIGAYPYWAYVYDCMDEKGVTLEAAETAARAYFGKEYGITDYSYTEWFDVFHAPMKDDDGNIVSDTIGMRKEKPVYGYQGWWGYDSMPVIKSTNGSEYRTGNWAKEIIEGSGSVGQYWISKGSDGWRLDVANEVSNETWQHFRDSVKGLNKDAVIIGEIWTDATKYLKGDMYDSVMNYVFRTAVTNFAKGGSAVEATNELEKLRERYPEEAFYAMMNLVGSHDTARILSYLDGVPDDRNDKSFNAAFPSYAGTSSAAKERQYLVSFLQFTYPGAPTIYYGDEIGMVGADDPDDRRAMEWGKGNQELVEWYAKLAAVRAKYPALRTGDLSVIDTDSTNLMGFTRALDGQELIVVANNSESARNFTPADTTTEYTDIITGETRSAGSDWPVPSRRGIILVPSTNFEAVSIKADALKPAYASEYIVPDRDTTPTHKHNYKDTVVPPTCTEDGYTKHVCACGHSYNDTPVAALGHDSKLAEHKDPTCTEAGYTKYHCSRCGEEYTETEKALGHNGQMIEHKDPTCTGEGLTKYRCSRCGEEYTETEKALGHNFEKVEHKAPTCTEDGYTKYRCSRCGLEYIETEKALGHDGKEVKHKDPTCTKDGYTKYHCSRCGKDYTEVEKATGHGALELKNAKEATCTKTGYTGDKVCTVCGKVVEKGETIAKLPHDYQNGYCAVCNAKKGSPLTGDTFNMTLCIVIMIGSAAGIVILAVVLHKKKKR